MKILLILAHPNPNSFNHAIASNSLSILEKNGHVVYYHDLYKEKFDPILPAGEIPRSSVLDDNISRHCTELTQAEGIIIIHPNWWGQPPAILKGWIDRIIRPGVAYQFLEGDNGEGIPVGLLKARSAVVFNTANTPAERENMVFGDPLERLWKDCIFGLCGISDFYRNIFRVVVTSDQKSRSKWLSEVRELLNKVYPKE
jgi:NAD(P)H dehydrogenase (quinone)